MGPPPSADDLLAVDRLIARLNDTEPMPSELRRFLSEVFQRGITATMFELTETTGADVSRGAISAALGAPGFWNLEQDAIKPFIRSKAQDLGWQCRTVGEYFTYHQRTGDIIPPHYPERIAILLRKAKELAREKAWLAAWCRHFGHDGWDGWFRDRLRKLSSISN